MPESSASPWTRQVCALLQAAVLGGFSTHRESNQGKIIRVQTNLSQKMWAVATGQNYLLKTWRVSKLDKQKGISWGQEGNSSTLSYLHLPTSSDSLIGFLIQMDTQKPWLAIVPFSCIQHFPTPLCHSALPSLRSQQDADYGTIIFSSNLHFRQLSVSIPLFLPLCSYMKRGARMLCVWGCNRAGKCVFERAKPPPLSSLSLTPLSAW